MQELIQEHSLKSEQKLSELKRLHDEEKERLERRVEDQKARFDKKLNQAI